MKRALSAVLIMVFTITYQPVSQAQDNDYEPKKVPSTPFNLQKLALDIFTELQQQNGSIEVGGRLTFYIDQFDTSYFEFNSVKSIGRSGERVLRFLYQDGKVFYAREIDFKAARDAQGTLYEDLNGKWEKYLREKEIREKQQPAQ